MKAKGDFCHWFQVRLLPRFWFLVGLPFVLVACSMASGNPTVVDAGPAKTLIFPAKDLSLFGHATDPENDPLTIQWTQTSGPTGVSFSAPNALMTTLSFTNTGTYTFQLSVNDGTTLVTSNVTITVNPASNQTAFYVDPTYTGRAQTGSASAPWKSLLDSDGDYASKWSTITTALASNDVIIYFSARQAGSDTVEQIVPPNGGRMFINRACRGGTTYCSSGDTTGPHRLTLDGMSMYNTNDATPSWASYTGTNKFRINCSNTCGSMSMGWDDNNQRDYITIRGFDITGAGARISWGGNYSYLERMWVHDVTTLGATVQFMPYVHDGTCNPIGIDHDVTVRNNVIERGIGEGIYMAANYNLAADGGCVSGPNSGDGHYDILIEGNTITDPGINGDQGDGIDIKAGIYNLTVRGNTVSNTHAGTPPNCSGGDGITALGRMPNSTHESNFLIENNVLSHGGCAINGSSESSTGIAIGALWEATVRNNVINTFPGEGIVAWTRDVSTPKNQSIRIYNNTIYNSTLGGIAFSDFIDGPVLRNNLIFNSGGATIDGTVPSIDSDYNLLSPTGSNLAEGRHTIVRTSGTGIVVNASGGDFHLTSTSPAKDVALSLSTLANLAVGTTAFSADIANVARPQGAAWDISAYEYPSGTATYSSSGTVKDGGGVAISGVTVSLTGTSSGGYTTGADGTYSFSGLVTGNYTVTPGKSGYTFSPINRSYTSLSANQTGQDFTGTVRVPTYSISGTVTASGGGPPSGVTVTLPGTSGGTYTTGADGTYFFSGLISGNYTVTPTKSGYTFSPVNHSYTSLGANQTAEDFAGTASTFYFSDNFENWSGGIGPWDEWRCDVTNCTGLVVRDTGTVYAGSYSLKTTDNSAGNGYEANLRDRHPWVGGIGPFSCCWPEICLGISNPRTWNALSHPAIAWVFGQATSSGDPDN